MSEEPQPSFFDSLADRFLIERELGQGGMATVYLARDLKHDRRVAIKVLRPELAAALGTERFLREIQIAAKLSHPHILPLYDSGEAAGNLYFVMPYVEGESLRDRLARDGRLEIQEALRLAAEVAGAIDYANEQGICHRDIKPENILLHTGQAVVSDFGIARAIDAAAATRQDITALTGTGVVIGTPLYMSPEQVLGDPVDGRTDVYALGCVLYEMLVGEPPFKGPSAQAILARHTLDPVPSVRKVRADIPVAVDRSVLKALEKDPNARFSSAAAFRDALTGVAPTPAAPFRLPHVSRRVAIAAAAVAVVGFGLYWTLRPKEAMALDKSVAILPFENRSDAHGDQYFADGMTDELIDALVRIPGLRVASRTSAFAAHDAHLGSRQIGTTLHVATLLEASIQRAGPVVRVGARLIRATDDSILWSETYERRTTDVFAMQDEISHAIVNALQVRLVGVSRPLVQRSTANTDAYDWYLKARYSLNQRGTGPAAVENAIAEYRHAIVLDSSYAQAWAGLAQAYGFLAGFSTTPAADAFAQAKTAALRAIALDSAIALAHTSLAFIAVFHDWDWSTAARELDKAQALDSTEPYTYLYRAWYFRCRGQLEPALAAMRTAQRLDPLNRIFGARVGNLLNSLHRYSAAEAELRQALALDSSNREARVDLFQSLILQRQYGEAFAVMPPRPDYLPYPFLAFLGYGYGVAGRQEEARQVEHQLADLARKSYVTPEARAYVAMGLGDTTGALGWLEQGFRERSFFLWTIGTDPVFEPLHGHPRFERLLQGMGIVEPSIPPGR